MRYATDEYIYLYIIMRNCIIFILECIVRKK